MIVSSRYSSQRSCVALVICVLAHGMEMSVSSGLSQAVRAKSSKAFFM